MSALVKPQPTLQAVYVRPDATDAADQLLLDALFNYHEKRLTLSPAPKSSTVEPN